MQAPAATESSDSIDLTRFQAAPLVREPFDHVVVPGFLRDQHAAEIAADFPRIDKGGSFATDALDHGPSFARLLEELRGPEVTRAFAAKFGLDLAGRPMMLTVRGQSRTRDGLIHTDSRNKLLTALLYLNDEWSAEGGRLRLLRGPDDIENYAAEVPPLRGTLLAFRCGPTAWHGHLPYIGPRRSLQINWMRGAGVTRREQARHRLSGWTKQLLGRRPAARR